VVEVEVVVVVGSGGVVVVVGGAVVEVVSAAGVLASTGPGPVGPDVAAGCVMIAERSSGEAVEAAVASQA